MRTRRSDQVQWGIEKRQPDRRRSCCYVGKSHANAVKYLKKGKNKRVSQMIYNTSARQHGGIC